MIAETTAKPPVAMTKVSIILMCLLFFGCGSHERKIQYYALTAEEGTPVAHTFTGAIGIGPVSLPEIHTGDAVFYRREGQSVVIADESLWAGDLNRAISRVVAQGLGKRLDKQDILSFPWDPRMRPDRQILVAVNQFSGPLNGEVVLEVAWRHFDPATGSVRASGGERFVSPPQSRTVAQYVAELNRLLNQFTDILAQEFAAE